MNKFQPSRTLFYILSFTWGIILSTLGAIAALFLRALGYYWYPNQYGYIIFIGNNSWGGFTLGPYSFVCPDASPKLLDHEAGHSYQNALFGPLTVILTIISIFHYWISCFVPKVQNNYYDFWTEKNASQLGENMAHVTSKRSPKKNH